LAEGWDIPPSLQPPLRSENIPKCTISTVKILLMAKSTPSIPPWVTLLQLSGKKSSEAAEISK